MLSGAVTKQFWLDLHTEIRDDNIFNGAAALAFYFTLAIFPALISLLSIVPYLPIQDVDEVILEFLHQGLPEEAADLVEGIVSRLAEEQRGSLLSFGVAATLWAATTGMYAIMRQLNITYNVEEARSFVRGRLTALLLSVVFATLIIGASLLVVLGDFLQVWLSERLGHAAAFDVVFETLRWGVAVLAILTGLAIIYRYAPNTRQEFRLVSPGSVVGTVLLVLASLGFSLYIRNFGSYDATYGSIGAVIILMLWLYASGLVILLGSEVDVLLDRYRRGGKHTEVPSR